MPLAIIAPGMPVRAEPLPEEQNSGTPPLFGGNMLIESSGRDRAIHHMFRRRVAAAAPEDARLRGVFGVRKRVCRNPLRRLLDRHRFREVAGLVDIGARVDSPTDPA